MASTKEYRDYILEQLSLVPGVTCRPMMGEFLLYADGVLFGGIYDDRLLVKITPGNGEFGMSEALPYDGAKKMYLVDEVDDKEALKEIVEGTVKSMIQSWHMLIFSYRMISIDYLLANEKIFRIDITNDEKDNVITWFRGKKYKHTLEPKDIKHIIKIIKDAPGLFDIPKKLEPNDFDDYGMIYYFVFSDGERTNRFSGQNILDYGRLPRKNAILALRTARKIKEKVLDPNHIRTMISSRLQHWEKYQKQHYYMDVCGNPKLPKDTAN